MTTFPASSAGLMTAATSSARAAANSSASERGSSSIAGSFNRSRMRSPAGGPAGSRTRRAAAPKAVVAEHLGQPPRLRGLAGSVDSFDRHEQAGHRTEATIARHMKAVVTGGAGFIGSNLVDALLERGDEVVVVDNLSTGKRENLEQALAKGARLVEADIRDAQALADLFEEVRPDVVFHFAA